MLNSQNFLGGALPLDPTGKSLQHPLPQTPQLQCGFSPHYTHWKTFLPIKLLDTALAALYTFFTFLRKQTNSVVYVLIRAVLFGRNFKIIMKQCVSYSNFTIFLNSWEMLAFNYRNWMFFSLFTYFCTIMLKATQNIDQSIHSKYMGN